MKSILQIVIAMVIWGSVGIFVKFIDMPSLEIAFLRAVIASGFLALAGIWLKRKDKSSYSKRNLLLLIGSGAAIGLNWVLLFQAYKYTTVSNATLSYYFAPVFVILLSPVVLKEKITPLKIFSAVGAMAGLFLILSNQSNSVGGQFNHVKGMMFGLSAAVLYASVVLLNKYIKDFSGYEMTLIQMSTASIVLLPFIIARGNLHIGGLSTALLVLVVGIVHTGIAYLIYFSAIKNVRAQSAAILSYIDPVSAIIFGTLILAEPVNGMQILGGLLILGSTFIGEWKKAAD
jgi:drug/metabolite transporter (DMT)-like permease